MHTGTEETCHAFSCTGCLRSCFFMHSMFKTGDNFVVENLNYNGIILSKDYFRSLEEGLGITDWLKPVPYGCSWRALSEANKLLKGC